MANKKGLNKYYDFSKHETSHYGKYEESYGAIVVAKSYDKVLLVSSGPDNNQLGFPKGHRNDGENDVGAAIREVKEETDVTIDMGDFILDDKGQPMTFSIEFPWAYGEDVLIYHISKIIDKQKNTPSERPYWNKTGSLKKRITLYLVPVEMDRFKIKAENENADVKWFTWEEAFQKMSEKRSNHIEALVDAFEALQKIKKIDKSKQLPKVSPKLKADIKARYMKEAKMISQPISKWPKNMQPKNWKEILDDMKGVSRPSKQSKETEDTDDDASEESSEEEPKPNPKKGGDDNDMSISITAFLIGVLLVGFVLLMFHLISAFHSGNETIEERVGTPMT